MMDTRRLLLVAVVLCSVPAGVFLNEACFTGCKVREDGEITCKWSNLTSVPDNLSGNVSVLTMFFNRLPVLRNKELLNKGYANTVVLHLPLNNIAQLEDEAFSGLVDLRVVTLEHNQITTFNKDIFRDNLKLQELYLGANPLTLPSSDTVSLVNSVSLTMLSIFYCNSTGQSTGWFSETPNLRELDVGIKTWTTLELFAVNHPEFWAETNLRNISKYHVTCPPHTLFTMTELSDKPADPSVPTTQRPYREQFDMPDTTVTCDCCLSLGNYALEKYIRASCPDVGRDSAHLDDLVHLKRCYATFEEGFKATHSESASN